MEILGRGAGEGLLAPLVDFQQLVVVVVHVDRIAIALDRRRRRDVDGGALEDGD